MEQDILIVSWLVYAQLMRFSFPSIALLAFKLSLDCGISLTYQAAAAASARYIHLRDIGTQSTTHMHNLQHIGASAIHPG
jgi:hypothetical protein